MSPWPPEIEVGDRVHCGVTSPDTGVVLSITKNRRWARVQWDKNGTHRQPMDRLFSVTRSLTEWVSYKRGKAPCVSCGYPRDSRDGRSRKCWLCRAHGGAS